VEPAFGADPLERLLSLVDDHVRDPMFLELSDDLRADAAVSADDEVVA